MPKMESFDVSTGVDLQEVDNAVNQARKEITNRFDFKNVLAEIDFDRTKPRLSIHTADEFKLEAIWQVLVQRFNSRSVPLKNVKRGSVEKAGGNTVRSSRSSRTRATRRCSPRSRAPRSASQPPAATSFRA
jgi:uncharacterized protein YajQ (UPF0234 family)